jgi:hypothetical protein
MPGCIAAQSRDAQVEGPCRLRSIQVEVRFSILQGQSLSGSFTSLKQLQEHIDAYVNAYNDKAEPFV